MVWAEGQAGELKREELLLELLDVPVEGLANAWVSSGCDRERGGFWFRRERLNRSALGELIGVCVFEGFSIDIQDGELVVGQALGV